VRTEVEVADEPEANRTGVMLVLTTVPDRDHAERIAQALVEERLAACVNILVPAVSIYRWQGALERADELPLLIKTAAARLPELERRLLALHPYDVPEIVAVPVSGGHSRYLDWVLAESGAAPAAG
jgi:periplasmic divalent cation tolerance protein